MSIARHPTHPGWWQITYYPDGKNGRKKVIVLKDGNINDARAYEALLRGENSRVRGNISIFPAIAEVIPIYLKHYSLDHLPSGVAVVARYMERWAKIIGRLKFASLTSATMEDYKHRRLSDGIKPTSINKELSALSGLLRWAVDQGYCQSALELKRFPRKMTKAPLPDVPTREEVLALINCMIWPKCGLFACLYYAGLRASEAAGLTADKVHLNHGILIVRGKGNKERPVPIVDELRPFLEKRLAEVSNGLLWGSRSGEQISDLKKIIKLAKERAGLTRHFYPHLLRHAFGTHATQLGVNLRSLQYVMGHTTSQTTEIYTTLSSEAVVRELKGKFGKLL